MVQGSLCLKNGVLYVGRHAKTAAVASYDLDGHALETRFAFRDAESGRSSVEGLSVDDDHRIWVADAGSARLRGFTLFGQEVAVVGAEEDSQEDLPGSIGIPMDVVARGADDTLEILVASRGVRRHALQVLFPETGRSHSLRPLGDPRGSFQDVVSIACAGDQTWACERRARRVQVFRHGDFYFSFQLPAAGGYLEPAAVAALEDGRSIVAVCAPVSALLLVDSSGQVLRTLAAGDRSSSAAPHEEAAAPAPEAVPEGTVRFPTGVVVESGARDRDTRLAVIDCDAERVQVFNLEGTCYGAFTDLPTF